MLKLFHCKVCYALICSNKEVVGYVVVANSVVGVYNFGWQ